MTIGRQRVATWTIRTEPADSGLDLVAYSQMKHGDAVALRAFGTRLGHDVVARVPELVDDPAQVLLPVAYLAVRPACWYLARHVLEVVNGARGAAGHAPGRIIHVRKDAVTARDYSTSGAADRARELASIGFTVHDDLDGAQLLVVDDVRVTGAAEETVFAALDRAPGRPVRSVAAYVAVVEGAAATDPRVESRLNSTAARTLDDLRGIAREDGMHVTIRMLKRVLGAPQDERRRFLADCPASLREEMRSGALATGPAFLASYPDGVADLDRGLVAR